MSTERSGLVSVGSGFIAPRDDQRLAVGHAALEPAGAVGLAVEAALGGVEDLVVRQRAGLAGEREALAEFTPLTAWIEQSAAGQPAVEALLPGDVRAEPGHEAVGAHLEDPAERLVGLALHVDVLDHRARASASRQRTGEASTSAKSVERERLGVVGRTHRRRSGARARRPRRRAPRRNALQSAPPATRAAVSRALARSSTSRTSVKPYFCTPARSAWPGRGRCTSSASRRDGPGVHPLLPVGVVAVCDPQRDRAAERAAVAHAGRSARRVSRSIFIRPPRPWPSWRRAMSRLIASRSSCRPAGSPSSTQVRPGPCDSPAVTTARSASERELYGRERPGNRATLLARGGTSP